MNLVTIARIGGALGFLVLCWFAQDRFHQAGLVKALTADRAACAVAAQTADQPLDKCPAEVAARVTAARRGVVCETALKEGNLYVIRAACPEQAKRLGAELTAAQADLADLRLQIAAASKVTDAAVARAEARGTATARREAENARTIQSAPRSPDGRVRCDADCLRALSETGGDRPGP